MNTVITGTLMAALLIAIAAYGTMEHMEPVQSKLTELVESENIVTSHKDAALTAYRNGDYAGFEAAAEAARLESYRRRAIAIGE